MLIHTRYTNDGWSIDESTANLIPELRSLIETKELGIKAVAFVAISTDPTSFLFEVYDDEEIRTEQAFMSVFEGGDFKKFIKNKKIVSALEKYHDLCETPGMKLRKQYRQGVKAVGDWVENNSTTINADNFKEYVDSLAKLPAQIKQFDEMKKGDQDDVEQVKKIIRGDRKLTYAEQKRQKKKK